jgi:hypothetical protein
MAVQAAEAAVMAQAESIDKILNDMLSMHPFTVAKHSEAFAIRRDVLSLFSTTLAISVILATILAAIGRSEAVREETAMIIGAPLKLPPLTEEASDGPAGAELSSTLEISLKLVQMS